jgi:hypothetical protein
MHRIIELTIILLVSACKVSASSFHRTSLISPSLRALHLRGGDLEDVATPEIGDDLDVPFIGEDIIAEEESMEGMIVEPPTSEPTMQRLSKRMASYRQPASPEPVESLLEDKLVPPPVSYNGSLAMIATAAAGLKKAFLNALVAYPLLKYVLAAFVALIVITFVKGIFEESDFPPPSADLNIKAIVPALAPATSKSKAIKAKISAGNPQMLASILIGGLGMIAGSLAMAAESAEDGFANGTSSTRKRGVMAFSASSIHSNSVDDGESVSDVSRDDVKKVGAGAAGGAFASGLIGRSVVISKILSVMF